MRRAVGRCGCGALCVLWIGCLLTGSRFNRTQKLASVSLQRIQQPTAELPITDGQHYDPARAHKHDHPDMYGAAQTLHDVKLLFEKACGGGGGNRGSGVGGKRKAPAAPPTIPPPMRTAPQGGLGSCSSDPIRTVSREESDALERATEASLHDR